MARLILLNGMPAVGKTTLARRYAQDHPFALVLDIDSVRRMLGRWEDDAGRAGLAARVLTVAMARAHLQAGFDVVVPQYLGRPEFLTELDAVAREVGVPFHEFVLSDDRDSMFRRFAQRTGRAAEPGHVEAARHVEALGGEPVLASMYDRLLLILNHRPAVQVVHCPDGAQESVYRELLQRLARSSV